MLSISVRPLAIESRQFRESWKLDLVKVEGNASTIRRLADRSSRLVMLVKLPEFKAANTDNVLQAFTDKQLGIAQRCAPP